MKDWKYKYLRLLYKWGELSASQLGASPDQRKYLEAVGLVTLSYPNFRKIRVKLTEAGRTAYWNSRLESENIVL